jgi:hypothetical protein
VSIVGGESIVETDASADDERHGVDDHLRAVAAELLSADHPAQRVESSVRKSRVSSRCR